MHGQIETFGHGAISIKQGCKNLYELVTKDINRDLTGKKLHLIALNKI
jgi:hypothetical protein